MSNKITVDRELIKEAMQAAQERDAGLEKVAALEVERNVVYGVLELVQDGLLDPSSVLEKVAEYLNKPEDLELFKKASHMSAFSFSIGQVSDSGAEGESSGESPEAHFADRLGAIAGYKQ